MAGKLAETSFFLFYPRLRIKRSHIKKKKKKPCWDEQRGAHTVWLGLRTLETRVERTSQLWQSSLESKGVKPYVNLLRPGTLHWEDKLPQCLTENKQVYVQESLRAVENQESALKGTWKTHLLWSPMQQKSISCIMKKSID